MTLSRTLSSFLFLNGTLYLVSFTILLSNERECHDIQSIFFVFQIASLKAALARKEGESDHIQNMILSPEVHRMKAGGPSPVHSNRQGGGDMSGGHSNHRQPMEDVGNIEVSYEYYSILMLT